MRLIQNVTDYRKIQILFVVVISFRSKYLHKNLCYFITTLSSDPKVALLEAKITA